MKNSCTLNIIYKTLTKLKFSLFCHDDNSCCCDNTVSDLIVNTFLDECYVLEDHPCSCPTSLICLLRKVLSYIENCSNCDKNYAYLLQVSRLKCIIKNLEKLLYQLRCLKFKNCCLYSKLVCTLLKIIELLENIISKISNLECLCAYHVCCDCEIIECVLCDLVDDINDLEENVHLLSQIIVEIACQNVINCTPCSTTKSVVVKEHDCCKHENYKYLYDEYKNEK